MNVRPRPVLVFALLLAICAGPACAQTSPAQPAASPGPASTPANPAASTPPVYIVSYIEVGPASVAKAAGILHRYAVFSRKAAGNIAFIALRERRRPGRFAIVEAWHDTAAYDAQIAAAKAISDRLQPLLVAPIDSRPSTALDVAASPADSGPQAKGVIYVLTHVDVLAAGKNKAVKLVEQLAADSRKDAGNLRFDVLVQDSRTNHMTLVAAWRDRTARNAYVTADHTRKFRAEEAPLGGALYDERLYEVVR